MSNNAWLSILLIAGILLAGCANTAAKVGGDPPKKGGGRRGDMAVPVTVAKVIRKDVPVEIEVIGTVEAYSTVAMKAQVGGEL